MGERFNQPFAFQDRSYLEGVATDSTEPLVAIRPAPKKLFVQQNRLELARKKKCKTAQNRPYNQEDWQHRGHMKHTNQG
ncbi:hypothetical protein [Ovoidimarina sediminis]|uniref:hypothetical protein n=1 Tax=Ovoidimarina sediminis TaxID=3079856 RepID=UPI0029316B7A|nr:hypothetical protein [Rhodophyticola sp. MJ-SS7]